MVAKNDITGDSIRSKSANKAYRDNWDLVFGKKEGIEPISEGVKGDYAYLEKHLSSFKIDPEPNTYLSFSISSEQREKINNWLQDDVYPDIFEQQRKDPFISRFINDGDTIPYQGAIGGGLTYLFIPTSLGIILKVKYGNNELDLTDYDSF